ncbi:Sugar lactone lactonase YvrE [Aquimarina amphilecti]|uniref:Sugar lactone lactonase YvrE n=1 Tax=Aquimarina amphilecti TaxID=1038014 RepID=A0A1H7TQR7_AQUAM|nr:IPT/TIG domain-containing protein [Aquimarina amphilecti]SEL86829.1 Sugar lactone lactonase YvrE [Aquimarina amphilecti]
MNVSFKNESNKPTIIIVILIMIIGFGSCSEDNEQEEILIPIATLTNMNPISGPKATVVTINGTNFSDINTVQVFFNEVEAVVESVSVTQIKAKVPSGAGTGLIKVISNDVALVGQEFTYILTTAVTTIAGGSLAGITDGTGIDARFNNPRDITVDAQGNVYVAGGNGHRIRKITSNGIVTTLAGSIEGSNDGTDSNAQFNLPSGVALDIQGNLYVADTQNRSVRKITPTGVVSTLAGGTLGLDDGTGTDAEFAFPTGITIDTQGDLYTVDGSRIRKITPTGVVTTIAGSGAGFEDGTTATAKFNNPKGIAIDAQNNLYIADTQNHRIRKITPDGTVSTLAGSIQGFQDGSVTSATFNNPRGITIDSQNNLYIADSDNHKIRKITPNGIVSTIAGTTNGFADGNANESNFSQPNSLAIDLDGSLYIADQKNHRVRKIVQD